MEGESSILLPYELQACIILDKNFHFWSTVVHVLYVVVSVTMLHLATISEKWILIKKDNK